MSDYDTIKEKIQRDAQAEVRRTLIPIQVEYALFGKERAREKLKNLECSDEIRTMLSEYIESRPEPTYFEGFPP